MLNLESLKNIHNGMKSDVEKSQKLLANLDTEIQKIQADGTRHPTWIKEKIDEARAKALPAIGEVVRTFDERNATVQADRPNWLSKSLLLSRQKFDADAATDATIKIASLTEFAAMDSSTLQLVAANASSEKNLPLVWCAYLSGLSRAGQPGWAGFALDKVEIPGQAEALDLIARCQSLLWLAHSAYSQASGHVPTGLDKMQSARAQAALTAA